MQEDPEDRVDPMARIFPRVTKCTFKKFGLNFHYTIVLSYEYLMNKRSVRNPPDSRFPLCLACEYHQRGGTQPHILERDNNIVLVTNSTEMSWRKSTCSSGSGCSSLGSSPSSLSPTTASSLQRHRLGFIPLDVCQKIPLLKSFTSIASPTPQKSYCEEQRSPQIPAL